MHTIQNILNEYSNIKNENMRSYLKIAQNWKNIMGETLSTICYPSFFKNGVLALTVIDSVWANEIFMRRMDIFNNIKKETNIIVSELKTRIGEIENDDYNSSEEKNDLETQIDEKDKIWIEKIIKESDIKDKKMRETFYRILTNVAKE